MSELRHLPSRLLALPMYLMLALTREGYRHALRTKVKMRMPQYAVLASLEEFGPCSQKAIAACVGFDKSDVTKIINDLETRALVRRMEDAEDNRRHRVMLTSKGRQELRLGERELAASMRDFLRGLNLQEYRQLQRLLLQAIQVHDDRFRSNTSSGGGSFSPPS
jgi:MarR family transcriptional regulator, lower aerobic nicotinate degradation pathway regulator